MIEARNGDFTTRLAFASQCKQRGNNYFSTGEFNNAIFEYERALSMFCWVVPLSPNWETEVSKMRPKILMTATDGAISIEFTGLPTSFLNLLSGNR